MKKTIRARWLGLSKTKAGVAGAVFNQANSCITMPASIAPDGRWTSFHSAASGGVIPFKEFEIRMSEKEPNIEEDVINALMETWAKYPDMRLGQLLVNAIAPKEPCPEIFYVEDSQLIKNLNRFKDQ